MKKVSAEDLDRMFDDGDPLTEYRGETYHFYYDKDETRALTLNLPAWLVGVLDIEAARRGIARKALINTILVDWADDLETRPRFAYSQLWERAEEDIPHSSENESHSA